MSQRPQPVTSKFRNNYVNDIFHLYDNSDKSSSAGSTSSLTSVLYHESFDDESIKSDDHYITTEKILNCTDQTYVERKPSAGMYCKRIIARQPQYPGDRVTLTKYDSSIHNKVNVLKMNVVRRKQAPNNPRITKSAITKNINPVSSFNKEVATPQKPIVRKIASKSRSLSEHSNNTKRDANQDNQSEDSYATNDFSTASVVSPATKISADDNVVIEEIDSSLEDTLSVSIQDPSDSKVDEPPQKEQTNQLLTAWEAWYLKKEKQKRKKQESTLLKEKEKSEKEAEEKTKRSQVCQEKIQNWLIKKEEVQKKEVNTRKKRQEREKNIKEQKKEDLMKKSSEKYVEWKLEKEKREKELEKQENQLKNKTEAEKMIKQAKAANAFRRWFEEHKDHQALVPYSYGISDGKLTSYYDKTSNPPPSFFNPDPWKPVIDIKN